MKLQQWFPAAEAAVKALYTLHPAPQARSACCAGPQQPQRLCVHPR